MRSYFRLLCQLCWWYYQQGERQRGFDWYWLKDCHVYFWLFSLKFIEQQYMCELKEILKPFPHIFQCSQISVNSAFYQIRIISSLFSEHYFCQTRCTVEPLGLKIFFYYDETVGNGKQSWCFISIWSTFFMHHSEWIGSPSNSFFSNMIDGVPKEVEGQLKDLKEAAEGDAKPKGETTSLCAEQTSILKMIIWKLSQHIKLS